MSGASLILSFLALSIVCSAITCDSNYTCYDDGSIVWVMKKNGNVNGPNCDKVCPAALCGSGSFYQCESGVNTPTNLATFNATVAAGLGFNCTTGGCAPPFGPSSGQVWVSIAGTTKKTCYLPPAVTYSCNSNPGNANCFGERYALVCPCKPKPLESACPWSSPPASSALAVWPTTPPASMTSCIDRINYWRQRACAEGWVECPPCGLPPMVECIDCHECVNSQAEYDSQNGAHKSFTRCGETSQGEGGGSSCANVIDTFVAERAPDANGVIRCQGHCGPIVSSGCDVFSWGKAKSSNFYTLNWHTCKNNTCAAYCTNPTSNPCFADGSSQTSSATALKFGPFFLLFIFIALWVTF